MLDVKFAFVALLLIALKKLTDLCILVCPTRFGRCLDLLLHRGVYFCSIRRIK